MRVTHVRGSVLLWQRCDTLCTSGFVDDIIFALSGPMCMAGASAHRGKWGQLTPSKMDVKLKSENMQFSGWGWGGGEGSCRERRYADHVFIHVYFSMHHFAVIFSKFSSPQAARGH